MNVEALKEQAATSNNETVKKCKCRVVLSDSEDDGRENEDTKANSTKNNTPTKAKGLVVRVEKSQPKPELQGLNEIKTQLGISANELEDARESLEVEDAARRKAGNNQP